MMHEFNVRKLQRVYSLSIINCHGVFVRHDSDVQTEESVARTAANWLKKEKSLERIERVMNHIHIYDLFLDVSLDECDSIAIHMLNRWNDVLKKIDPAFRVEKYEDYGPTVTFYKSRES